MNQNNFIKPHQLSIFEKEVPHRKLSDADISIREHKCGRGEETRITFIFRNGVEKKIGRYFLLEYFCGSLAFLTCEAPLGYHMRKDKSSDSQFIFSVARREDVKRLKQFLGDYDLYRDSERLYYYIDKHARKEE